LKYPRAFFLKRFFFALSRACLVSVPLAFFRSSTHFQLSSPYSCESLVRQILPPSEPPPPPLAEAVSRKRSSSSPHSLGCDPRLRILLTARPLILPSPSALFPLRVSSFFLFGRRQARFDKCCIFPAFSAKQKAPFDLPFSLPL